MTSRARSPIRAFTAVFDGLQKSKPWSIDTTGYNFLWTCPATFLTGVGRLVQVDIKFTPASGEAFEVPCVLNLKRTYA